jgi:tetratricopeptide (TPR) repeat protein
MKKCPRVSEILLLLCLLSFILPLRASEADYKSAVKALAANDFPTALRYLELAITDDPENVRYASEYRQAAIRAKEFDRSLQFFQKAVAEHPNSANLYLNFGFAYVDKIPAAGSITQVILANNAQTQFSKAIELQPNWIGYYTRGASYLFWPKVFNRAALGVADLQKAMAIQKKGPRHSYYVRTYIALGDGYWKTDDLEKARATWKQGLKEFPGNEQLKTRLSQQGDQLKATIEDQFDPNKRVNTDLSELWSK